GAATTTMAPFSGNGTGIVNFSMPFNNSATARTATIDVQDKKFTVTQAAGCQYQIAPQTVHISSAGSTTGVFVRTGPTCGGSVDMGTVPSWVTITTATSGTGNGGFQYDAAANTGAGRIATIVISGQPHTIIQDGNCII